MDEQLTAIRGEKKEITFVKSEFSELYLSEEQVYVKIPQGGTTRSYGLSQTDYENKVRKARLYIYKSDGEFNWATHYRVMDGIADIVTWIDSKHGKSLESFEAQDTIVPTPICE